MAVGRVRTQKSRRQGALVVAAPQRCVLLMSLQNVQRVPEGLTRSSALDQQAWNRAILDWYFAEHVAGRPVYLSVDDGALKLIASAQRWDLADPASDLTASLRTYLDQTRPFRYWDAVAERWEQAGSRYPRHPCSRLGADGVACSERRDALSGAGYYPPLFDVLGIADTPARREDYRWNVPSLWRRLATWLQSQSGHYGLPTATEGTYSAAYLGWSRSQAIIAQRRSSGVHRLLRAGRLQTRRERFCLALVAAGDSNRWCTRSRVSDRVRQALADAVLRSRAWGDPSP